jgi:hypothetical protein
LRDAVIENDYRVLSPVVLELDEGFSFESLGGAEVFDNFTVNDGQELFTIIHGLRRISAARLFSEEDGLEPIWPAFIVPFGMHLLEHLDP